jgi:DNA repair protein RecO (recombination protein O)
VTATTKTEGIILRCVDFGESDRIVHLLTPDRGRLTAIAKSARKSMKRFPGTLDLANHLEIELSRPRRGAMPYLERARLLSPFLGLRALPARFALACYLIELLDRLAPEGGPGSDMRELFDFTLGALRAVEQSRPDAKLRVLLELRALEALGLRPELRHCVRCGSLPRPSYPVGFHVGEGGVVCGPCGERVEGLLPIHLGTLRALEQGLRFDLGRLDRLALSPEALREADLVVARFHRFHVGLELRSEEFLREVLHPITS